LSFVSERLGAAFARFEVVHENNSPITKEWIDSQYSPNQALEVNTVARRLYLESLRTSVDVLKPTRI
jgi:hypothetical protein